ncbi:MAG: ATP-grasp fold amidoligase family protein, partial [Eubacteriales bacterium]|nr:ATP-grasp fold amidoligase family protein [Eubacteriales bacterium]
MDDERYLRLLYHGVLGRPIHLAPPVLYSEKMQWLKLHDKNPIYTKLCDKIAVRDYVSQRVGEQYLIPLLGVWENPDEIDFTSLPNRFVLKCTHDSGSAILCADQSKFDHKAARETLKKKLKRDYSIAGREWPYHDVPRRVLAETHLGAEDGTPPVDFKFFCFHGKVELILAYVHQEDGNNCSYTFLPDFSEFPIYKNDDEPNLTFARPPHLEEMITLAETLSNGFAHMRVDLYDTAAGVKFGEITLHSSSG